MKESDPFERGIAEFNTRSFFEAHEVWEEIWLRAGEPEKTFLQGLIQVAAAFHHYGRGNTRGAGSLLAAGIAKLERFPDDHRGLALAEFRRSAGEWRDALETGTDPGRSKLPKIRRAARPADGAKKDRAKRKRGRSSARRAKS